MREYNFNFGWKFCDHDCDGRNFDRFAGDQYKQPQWTKAANNGLAISNFDDSSWEDVKLPHDFVIEKCEFTPEESTSVGCLRKGAVWYRKTFTLPQEIQDKRVFIRFDGVFRDSQVWLNGHFVGRHLGGYLGFTYELTEVLIPDGINTIAVFADATGYEGWWYEGGGIYRDVTVIATDTVKIAENSVFIKPFDINLDDKTCKLDVQLEVDSNNFSKKDCSYNVDILNPNGEIVTSVSGDICAEPIALTSAKSTTSIDNIMLWDVENPQMYTAVVSISSGDEADTMEQKFGVRKFEYDPVNGLRLNSNPIILKGVCGHDDLACVGTALNESTLEYKIKVLQSMGCNSYRCSHNPPSPVFLDLCDKMGFIVLDEHRLPGTSAECIDDFKNLIKRDRNHPSIIFYSMGNEEMAIQENQFGVNIFSKFIAIGEQLDDSRDYFFAINCLVDEILQYLNANGYKRHIHGVNYLKPKTGILQHALIHEQNPDMCFVSTETTGVCMYRGYMNDHLTRAKVSSSGLNFTRWDNKEHEGLITCYGDSAPTWGLTPEEALKVHDDKPYFLGEFIWTGFDYRGEVFPYEYPQVVSSFGIVDLCGFYKDWAYYLKAWWSNEPVLHVFPSWNLPIAEGEKVSVWAFSNCEEVELFINGESKGKQSLERLGHLEWDTTYNKGELKAVAYKDGKPVMEQIIKTSDKEYKLLLSTDKTTLSANHDDSTMIIIDVVDKDGNFVSDSCIDVNFTIEGAGSIKGTGNGNPQSLEHDKAPNRKLFSGKAIVAIESTFDSGDIIFTASAEGVESASITLSSTALDSMDNYIFSENNVFSGKLRTSQIDL